MKNILLILFLVANVATAQAQAKSGDTVLDRRLQEYLDISKQMDFDRMMDYIYPKMFSIVPRENLVQVFRSVAELPNLQVRFDNMGIRSVGSVFNYMTTEYRKVVYFATMRLTVTDTVLSSNNDIIRQMKSSFEQAFQGKEVVYNATNHQFTITGDDVLYAIREKQRPWMFIGYKKQPELVNRLFPKPVIQHFKML